MLEYYRTRMRVVFRIYNFFIRFFIFSLFWTSCVIAAPCNECGQEACFCLTRSITFSSIGFAIKQTLSRELTATQLQHTRSACSASAPQYTDYPFSENTENTENTKNVLKELKNHWDNAQENNYLFQTGVQNQLGNTTDSQKNPLSEDGWLEFHTTYGLKKSTYLEILDGKEINIAITKNVFTVMDKLMVTHPFPVSSALRPDNQQQQQLANQYFNSFYSELMLFLRITVKKYSLITMLQPGWNPRLDGTTTPFIPNLLGDYGVNTNATSLPPHIASQDVREELNQMLTQDVPGVPDVPDVFIENDLLDENSLHSQLNPLHSISGSSATIINLLNENGDIMDTIVILSNDNDFWFGSQNIGPFFTNASYDMTMFLSKVFHQLKTVLGYNKVKIYIRKQQ